MCKKTADNHQTFPFSENVISLGHHLLYYILTGTTRVVQHTAVLHLIQPKNIKVKMKAFSVYYMCTCACVSQPCQMTPITNTMWHRVLSASLHLEETQKKSRKHTRTRILSSVLHWQAVIPALAYERQQLEGVAVTVVVPCCVVHLDGTSSVLAIPRFTNVQHCAPSCLSVCLLLSVSHAVFFVCTQ